MQTLKERQTPLVVLCIDTRDGPARKRLFGISTIAHRYHWQTVLIRERGTRAIERIRQLQPNGIITFLADKELVKLSEQLQIPLIDTTRTSRYVRYTVSLQNERTAALAVEHFRECGLMNYGYCGYSIELISKERCNAFVRELKQYGITPHLFSQRISEGETNRIPLCRWLRNLPKPIGILAFDDRIGQRILYACQESGIAVPNDVAVLGIGDDMLVCEISTPSLSSIAFPALQFGLQAALLLQKIFDGDLKPVSLTIEPTDITVRGSTDIITVNDSLVLEAVRIMKSNVADDIGMVAKRLCVSRRTLDRHFKDILGRSASDLLEKYRLQQAIRMLSQGTDPLSFIAEMCGYSTLASFGRAFHRKMGFTPLDYRHRYAMSLIENFE